MKTKGFSLVLSGSLAIALVLLLLTAGCTSGAGPSATAPPTDSTTAVPVTTAPPATTSSTPAPVPTSTKIPTTTVSLSNNVTITYPSDWEKEEPLTTALREYGRTTTNIANFFSPTITPARNTNLANHDRSPYTTFSIDVDTQTHTDEDRYFNLATVAIQKSLGTIEITRHEQLPMAKGISGYKTYALEFDTKDFKRHYRFVNVDGRFVIITVKNPLPYSTEIDDMFKSIKITMAANTKSR